VLLEVVVARFAIAGDFAAPPHPDASNVIPARPPASNNQRGLRPRIVAAKHASLKRLSFWPKSTLNFRRLRWCGFVERRIVKMLDLAQPLVDNAEHVAVCRRIDG
jgi:hypothetical protein